MAPAISCLSCGDVSAGVCIFSPPRLLSQEPRGEKGQGLMMMPGHPVPHLIVSQTRFPLGTLEAFFDPVLGLGHAGIFLKRHFRIGI